jgi:hypothetical protein
MTKNIREDHVSTPASLDADNSERLASSFYKGASQATLMQVNWFS